ncbi:MAG: hypothetical protein IAF58_17795 [Leptolyngbya sp.]|nr:hypothetical protein [Candidatus Melainabacteria bacterium]
MKRKPEELIFEVTALADKVAAPLGFQVVDVRLTQQGRRKSVEITIFSHQKSVGLTDCETISRQLDEILEKLAESGDPLIEDAYVLEVQSPGIERELKTAREYTVFAGHPVLVKAKEKVGEVGSEFIGILEAQHDGKLHLREVKPLPVKKAVNHPKAANKPPSKTALKKAEAEVAIKPCDIKIDMKKVTLVRLYPDDIIKERASEKPIDLCGDAAEPERDQEN